MLVFLDKGEVVLDRYLIFDYVVMIGSSQIIVIFIKFVGNINPEKRSTIVRFTNVFFWTVSAVK